MTSGVVPRAVTEGDLAVFFDYQLDPDATRMAAFTARDRQTFMAHWTSILGDETLVKRTIVVDGQVAGNVVSWQQDGTTLVGYWIGRDFWWRGVASKALAAFLGQVDARPLYAHAALHNLASIRVLEKCGFTRSRQEPVADVDGDRWEEAVFILR